MLYQRLSCYFLWSYYFCILSVELGACKHIEIVDSLGARYTFLSGQNAAYLFVINGMPAHYRQQRPDYKAAAQHNDTH